jgi:GrpB-like predicted nucleotidyltransferase (UPF0157 family)
VLDSWSKTGLWRHSTVQILEYDPQGPKLFAAERDVLRALPDNPLIEIEHFSSTGVPGLSAKPVVDIMASVARLDDVEAFVPHLLALGYARVDVGFRERHLFVKPATNEDAGFHPHLIAAVAWAEKSERLFRDWLLAHQRVAEAYAQLKAELAERFAADPRGYTKAKSAFILAAVNDARAARGLPPETGLWE